MQPAEQHNVDVVLRYFDGCNTGELFWRKYKRMLDPTWRIDQIIGAGDLVVSEWSCRWQPSVTTPWVMSRGTEVARHGASHPQR